MVVINLYHVTTLVTFGHKCFEGVYAHLYGLVGSGSDDFLAAFLDLGARGVPQQRVADCIRAQRGLLSHFGVAAVPTIATVTCREVLKTAENLASIDTYAAACVILRLYDAQSLLDGRDLGCKVHRGE